MQAINKPLSDALDSYFNALSHLGYIQYGEVNKLLVMAFISEILEGKFGLLEEHEYRTITRATDCLFGTSCLLPYTEYLKLDTINNVKYPYSPRADEYNILRKTELNNLRSVE